MKNIGAYHRSLHADNCLHLLHVDNSPPILCKSVLLLNPAVSSCACVRVCVISISNAMVLLYFLYLQVHQEELKISLNWTKLHLVVRWLMKSTWNGWGH